MFLTFLGVLPQILPHQSVVVSTLTLSDPTTMKIGMLEAKRQTKKTGQAKTLFTADLQLYRVGLNLQWAYPELFNEDFVLRLGVMHSLMGYVGARVLVAGNGLEKLIKAVFGGVTKMLTGKNFPQNTRALRIVVEQVLHQFCVKSTPFMQELKAGHQRVEQQNTGGKPYPASITDVNTYQSERYICGQ